MPRNSWPRFSPKITLLLLASAIILFDLILIQSSLYEPNRSALSTAITLDFMLVLPLLLVLLGKRPLRRSITMSIPMILLGYIAVYLMLPPSDRTGIAPIGKIIIPLELALLTLQAYRFGRILLRARHVGREGNSGSPLDSIRQDIQSAFGTTFVSAMLTHELSVFYSLVFSWTKASPTPLDPTAFSTHRHSGRLVLVLIFSKLLLLEGVALHFLLHQFSPILAWITSLSNLYLILLMVADYRAMRLYPIQVAQQELRIQYGLQLVGRIKPDELLSVSHISNLELSPEEKRSAFVPSGTDSNVMLILTQKIPITGMFGRILHLDRICLHVDEPDAFITTCRSELQLDSTAH
ncbi:hypothetical protein [Paenibacillus herberti]|uniref:Beta-carotene 15,15'-monooxygenase n=1 Tax=Paenibacillus herberti TaxID=1619309 RepID=A0A229NZS3_9BACL|nr:hypothetical protein [Paenibacillus herberti]OXM15271.1 hypothetical protein CGZ75_00550 [Paenibacillus herberti]